MVIQVIRFSDNGNSTIGIMAIDGEFCCYTLEDEFRYEKVLGETRIPQGTYNIGVRSEGGFNGRYLKRFGELFHKGMLQVLDVPGFEYILIHCGNNESHTSGCLLVGDTVNNNTVNKGFIGESTKAYKRIYPQIINALQRKEPVTITYTDIDR